MKRGGGTGTGFYGRGFSEAGSAAEEQDSPVRPNLREPDSAGRGHDSQDRADGQVTAPAYRVTEHRQVVGNRVILDVLARWVSDGGEPEMSMLYEDALETFGADSMHFIAVCKGRSGVGAHYQRTVAGGQFSD